MFQHQIILQTFLKHNRFTELGELVISNWVSDSLCRQLGNTIKVATVATSVSSSTCKILIESSTGNCSIAAFSDLVSNSKLLKESTIYEVKCSL